MLTPVLFCLVFVVHSTAACTEFIVSCKDETTIVGRTMEYAINFKSNVISAPKGISFKSTVTENCKTSIEWESKHKVLYVNSDTKTIEDSKNIWLDGQNDAGLSVGVLYFPGYAWYPKTVPDESCSNALSHIEVAKYILSKFNLM